MLDIFQTILLSLIVLKLYLPNKVEKVVRKIEKLTEVGAIYIPEDESEMTKKEIIEKNDKEGKNTPIQDLMN